METTGFTENQLTVREAVGAVCAQFPNTYWQDKDQREEDPAEFHAALARDGWLGIALPEELGGSGLGISEVSISTIKIVPFKYPLSSRKGDYDDADHY